MNDPAILFVKPQAISAEDRARLTKAGVVVIEVTDPRDVKLVRATADLPGSTLLRFAAKAIGEKTMNGDGIIEVRVRQFFTSKEADAATSSTVLVQRNGSGEPPDWDRLLEHLTTATAEQIAGAPFTNVRLMTREEVDSYRENEAEEYGLPDGEYLTK